MTTSAQSTTVERSTVRLSLEVSVEMFNLLHRMSEQLGTSKADVLRKAIVLYEQAIKAKSIGQQMAIIDQDDRTLIRLIVL